MTSLKRRLLANFGANSVSRVLSMLIQIVSVPVVLSKWGAGVYGEWILLSTIPGYLSMSDIGFGNVAGNEMSMLVAGGKQDEALTVFQSVNLFITGVSAALAVLLCLGVTFLPVERWLGSGPINSHDARLIVVLLGLSALLTLSEGLLQASFRCVGKNALGSLAKSSVGLLAFAGVMISVLLGANPVRVAWVMVLINTIGTFALWRLLRENIDWIRFGVAHARLATIRRLLGPSVSFMSFPISNIINLQGTLVMIGFVFGPIGVVTFSTARTISRSALQAMQLINASVWPEISTAFGSGSVALVRKIHQVSCQFSIIACLGTTLVVALFGDYIWRKWTLGKFQTDPVLLNILLLQMLLGAFWFTSSVVPAAVNKHQGIAKVILGGSCLSLLVSYPLMKIGFLGLRGAAVASVLGDMWIASYVLKTSLKLVEDTVPNFCRSLLEVPALPMLRRSK